MYVVNADEMRKLDRHTIDQIGIPALVLMENAGRATAEEAAAYDGRRLRRFAVLAGKGNNGADGAVAARHLLEAGCTAELIYADDPAALQSEAAQQRDIAGKLGIPIIRYAAGHIMWHRYDGIIDALLGTGSRGVPRGDYAGLIREANASGLPVIALDIPSGLDADTGEAYEPCIQADVTVALAFTKCGLEQEPGARLAGRVVVRPIGIPAGLAAAFGVRTYRIDEQLLTDRLGLPQYERRSANAHKGTYGHALLAAGSRPMAGAGLLCAAAALRTGSGLVTWALPDALLAPMLGRLPEAMLRGMADAGRGDWSAVAPQSLYELAEDKAALAFGPGAGRWPGDAEWLRSVWTNTRCPLVLDADALNMIAAADDFAAWPRRTAPVVMTPHPGEMARLCGLDTAAVQRDRIRIARGYAVRHGVTLVLKGARTVVACPDGDVYINVTGNPGMATGGTGDVLTGIITGLLAQGFTATQAAALGVYLHGAAGDRAASGRMYTASLLAGDLLDVW
ncbi:NAD(P)H-hydrate dehydratase [Paenibacillus piri]|uniref:Bifunctional NAD(P)H-hydrate repair enzyme n=1 Tax=Paenibacillus piri TaxID=2547395 RepID=A0A4R5KVH1_9BACL|nr:NAD(P)H-hydrate dehydratase [Paenibacillus piri]TDF99746.1 NAD(P)H-hydrate dehydratase [Paenibacillus piri]